MADLGGAPEADATAPGVVIEHAKACFERYGIHRTRMEDIAESAGISRPALYRLFPNRRAVIHAVLTDHVEQLVLHLEAIADQHETFADTILECCVATIDMLRAKPDILRLADASNVADVSRSLLRSDTVPMTISARLWQPIIDRGRQRGEVRPDLDDQDFIEWISTLNLMYGMRDDIPLDRIRSLFRRHLVPCALAGAEKLIPS